MEFGADLTIETQYSLDGKSKNVLSLIIERALKPISVKIGNRLANIIYYLFVNNYKKMLNFYDEISQIDILKVLDSCKESSVIRNIKLDASLILLQGLNLNANKKNIIEPRAIEFALIKNQLEQIVINQEKENKFNDVNNSEKYSALLQKISNIDIQFKAKDEENPVIYVKTVNKKLFQQITISLWFKDCLLNNKIKRAYELFFLIDKPTLEQRKVLAFKLAENKTDILLFNCHTYQKLFVAYLLKNVSLKLLNNTPKYQFFLLRQYKEDDINVEENNAFIYAIENEVKIPAISEFIKLTKNENFQEEDCLQYINCIIQKKEQEANQYLPTNMSVLQFLARFAKHHSYYKKYVVASTVSSLYEQRRFNGAFYDILVCENWWRKYKVAGYYFDPNNEWHSRMGYVILRLEDEIKQQLISN